MIKTLRFKNKYIIYIMSYYINNIFIYNFLWSWYLTQVEFKLFNLIILKINIFEMIKNAKFKHKYIIYIMSYYINNIFIYNFLCSWYLTQVEFKLFNLNNFKIFIFRWLKMKVLKRNILFV